MKTVLIIDDKPSELERGANAARKLGLTPIVCDPTKHMEGECYFLWMHDIKKCDYVVTDLMWKYRDDHPEKPSGLLVVIHAKHLGKPVGICTQGEDYGNGHHGEAIGFIHDGYIMPAHEALNRKPAFVWNEDKDWDSVIRDVAGIARPPEKKVRNWHANLD